MSPISATVSRKLPDDTLSLLRTLARYTLDTLPNKVTAREPERSGDRLPQAARRASAASQYQLALPAVKKLEAELAATQKRLERAGRR